MLVNTVSPCPTPQARNAVVIAYPPEATARQYFAPGKFFFQQRPRRFHSLCCSGDACGSSTARAASMPASGIGSLGKTATEDVC
jgi:hypothetical protein